MTSSTLAYAYPESSLFGASAYTAPRSLRDMAEDTLEHVMSQDPAIRRFLGRVVQNELASQGDTINFFSHESVTVHSVRWNNGTPIVRLTVQDVLTRGERTMTLGYAQMQEEVVRDLRKHINSALDLAHPLSAPLRPAGIAASATAVPAPVFELPDMAPLFVSIKRVVQTGVEMARAGRTSFMASIAAVTAYASAVAATIRVPNVQIQIPSVDSAALLRTGADIVQHRHAAHAAMAAAAALTATALVPMVMNAAQALTGFNAQPAVASQAVVTPAPVVEAPWFAITTAQSDRLGITDALNDIQDPALRETVNGYLASPMFQSANFDMLSKASIKRALWPVVAAQRIQKIALTNPDLLKRAGFENDPDGAFKAVLKTSGVESVFGKTMRSAATQHPAGYLHFDAPTWHRKAALGERDLSYRFDGGAVSEAYLRSRADNITYVTDHCKYWSVGSFKADPALAYSAHMLGAGGASQFCRLLHNAPNATPALLPAFRAAANGNPSIFYDIQRDEKGRFVSRTPRTTAQVMKAFRDRANTGAVLVAEQSGWRMAETRSAPRPAG